MNTNTVSVSRQWTCKHTGCALADLRAKLLSMWYIPVITTLGIVVYCDAESANELNRYLEEFDWSNNRE